MANLNGGDAATGGSGGLVVFGGTAFSYGAAKTVTINRSASGRKTVVVDRDLFLFGTDDYMECPDALDGSLDIDADDSFTVLAVLRTYGSFSGAVIAKRFANQAGQGWQLRGWGHIQRVSFDVGDGDAVATSVVAAGSFDGRVTIASGVLSNTSVIALHDAVAGSPGTRPATSSAVTLPVQIGRFGDATYYTDMEFIGAAIIRRALSVAEIEEIGWTLINST